LANTHTKPYRARKHAPSLDTHCHTNTFQYTYNYADIIPNINHHSLTTPHPGTKLAPSFKGSNHISQHRKDGKGQFRDGSKAKLAHRVAWELTHGDLPSGQTITQECDTPGCVNPNHVRPYRAFISVG
jgi:hypothetical protein